MQFFRFRWSAPLWVAALLVGFHHHSLDATAGAGGRDSNKNSDDTVPGAAGTQQGNGGPKHHLYENWPLDSSATQPDSSSGAASTSQDGKPDTSERQQQEPTYINILNLRRSTNPTPPVHSSISKQWSESDSDSSTGSTDNRENPTGTEGGAGGSDFVGDGCNPDSHGENPPLPLIPPTYISYVGDGARRHTDGPPKGEPVYATIPLTHRDPFPDKSPRREAKVDSGDGNGRGWRDEVALESIYANVGEKSGYLSSTRDDPAGAETIYTEVRGSPGQKPCQPASCMQLPSLQDPNVPISAPDGEPIYAVLPLNGRRRGVQAAGDDNMENYTRENEDAVLYEELASFWGDTTRGNTGGAPLGSASGRGPPTGSTHSRTHAASEDAEGDYEMLPYYGGGTHTSQSHEDDIYGAVGGATDSATHSSAEHGEDGGSVVYEEVPYSWGAAGGERGKTRAYDVILGRLRRVFKKPSGPKGDPRSDDARD